MIESLFSMQDKICVVTGGSRGMADIPVLAGVGIMGGAMFRDFAIVATAFGAEVSALKKAEHEQAVILRLYNSSASPVDNAVIQTGFTTQQAYQCDFLEENQQALTKSNAADWQLPKINPFTAITIKFTLAAEK